MKTNNKIFIDTSNDQLVLMENPQNENYYTYIAKQKEKGFRQILITTQEMIRIMEFYFNNFDANIMEIVFYQNDDDYTNEIQKNISDMNKKLANFQHLIERLECINSEDSIDIQSIEFFYEIDNYNYILKIYLNGIVNINNHGDTSNKELDKLIKNIQIIRNL